MRNADRRSPLTVNPRARRGLRGHRDPVAGDGFDWAAAGIGAAGGIAILAILAGMAMTVTHRPHGPRVSA